MQIEIDDEVVSSIVEQDLFHTLEFLVEAHEDGGYHVFSMDLEEEREQLDEYIEAARLMLDWYSA